MQIIELACNESFRKARMVGQVLELLVKAGPYKMDITKRSDVWIYKFGDDYEIRLCPLNKYFLNKARKWRRENR